MLDKEMADAFKLESIAIVAELKGIIDTLNSPQAAFPSQILQEFSQKIDRIMGAAKVLSLEEPSHLGLKRMGALAELCKALGYKASEQKQNKLVPIFAAFFEDAVSVTEDLLNALHDEKKSTEISQKFTPVLIKRLEWLKGKLMATPSQTTQAEIDALIKNFT
jgi:hypothetical protein